MSKCVDCVCKSEMPWVMLSIITRVCNAVSQELISICVAECVVRVRGFKFRVLATMAYEDGLVFFC